MTVQLTFLLLPGYSMLGFTCAIEPFRVANRFKPDAYQWRLLSVSSDSVAASNGLSLNVDATLEQQIHPPAPEAGELFIIVAGFGPLIHYNAMLKRHLQRWSLKGGVIGAVDTGSFILAEAGLLDDYQATVHWESIPAFEEQYPHVTVDQALYVFDRNRMTCAGGTSALDMMLAKISDDHNIELAMKVSEQFVISQIRSRQDHQRMCIRIRYGVTNPRLLRILEDLEHSCESPVNTAELAQRHAVSVRQLERMFQLHLATTPTLFHLKLRLQRAQRLIRDAAMPILDVAIACGFSSSSYFSRSYRAHFGISPSQDRKQPTVTGSSQLR